MTQIQQDSQCMYNLTLWRVRVTIVVLETRYVSNIISAWLYLIFPHSLIKLRNFRGKKLLNTKCLFWLSLQLLSEPFLIPRTIQRYIIINVHTCSCKLPVARDRFQPNLNVLDWLKKHPQIWNFKEIHPVRAESIRAGGRTDGHTWQS